MVRNAKTKEPLDVDVIIRDAITLDTISIMFSDESDGSYSLVLNAGRNYKLEFHREGYLPELFDYNLYYAKGSDTEEKNIEMRSEADIGLTVFDSELDLLIPADIRIFDDEIGETAKIHIENYDEAVKLELDVNRKYTLVASKSNYLADTISVNTSDKEIPILKFYLTPKKTTYNFRTNDVRSKKRVRTKLILKNKEKDEIIENLLK